MTGRAVKGVEMATSAKEQARDAFGRRAAEWAGWYSLGSQETLEAANLRSRQRLALEIVQEVVSPPARVLDLGCGTGEVAGALMHRGYDVHGVDIAAPMIARAKQRWHSDRFRVADAERLPFTAGSFDAVVSLGVIEYQDRDDESLQEIRRVLKPGGYAVISTPSAVSPLYLLDTAVLAAEKVVRPFYYFLKYRLRGRVVPEDPSGPGLRIRRYRRGSWFRRLRRAGLEPDQWICRGWGWHSSLFGTAVRWLARTSRVARRMLERTIGVERVEHMSARFVRNPALNWLASEQLVRVRAVEE